MKMTEKQLQLVTKKIEWVQPKYGALTKLDSFAPLHMNILFGSKVEADTKMAVIQMAQNGACRLQLRLSRERIPIDSNRQPTEAWFDCPNSYEYL